MKTLIIIPAYNEAKNIVSVVENLKASVPWADYLIVNDASTDNTVEICKKNNYNYVSLPINLGIGGGVQTGYKYALENDYDIAVQHDGDGQHDPAYIENVIRPIIEGKANIVIGSRFIDKQGFQSSSARRAGIKLLSNLIKMCTGLRIYDVTSGYRAVDKKYMEFYANNYPTDYPEPEAIVAATLNGAAVAEVPVIMRERENGVSSINFRKSLYYMIKVSSAIIICRLSNRRPAMKSQV
jgi:hypothetical protein